MSFLDALRLCALALGTVLVVASAHLNTYAALPADPQIYWADSGNRILRASLDGTAATTVIPNARGNIDGLVVDRRTDHIYWQTAFDLFRSNLDGSQIISLHTFDGLAQSGNVTIDGIRNHLYFSDGRNGIVYRSEMDGTDVTVVVPEGATPAERKLVYNLLVDPRAEKLYWRDLQSFRRSNLDGSQQEILFTTPDYIYDFDLDPINGRIYWAATTGLRNGGSVRRANLDGSQAELLVAGDLTGPGLALDLAHGKMYFTDAWSTVPRNYDSTIRIANLDGSAAQTILNLGPGSLEQPFGIILDTSIVPEPASAGTMAIAAICLAALRQRRECSTISLVHSSIAS